MLLNTTNIQDLVTEQINTYLNHQHISFDRYKAYILNKLPIPPIQSLIVKKLEHLTHQALEEITKNITQLAATRQRLEDEQQEIKDEQTLKKDAALKKELLDMCEKIPQLLKEYDKTNPTHQQKISTLLDQQTSIKKQLIDIEARARERLMHHIGREERLLAVRRHPNSRDALLHSLSEKNKALLTNDIQKHKQSLEQKLSALIWESEQIHFAVFLEQLSNHLPHSTCPKPEIEALSTLIKTTQNHILHEQEYRTQQQLFEKNKKWTFYQKNQLNEHKAQIRTLNQKNPSLTQYNQELMERNKELTSLLDKQNRLRHQLKIFSKVSIACTIASMIPSFLMLQGAIPWVLSNTLFYLITLSPICLLLTTLGLSLAGAIYLHKANKTEEKIKINYQTIENNVQQIEKNHQGIEALRTKTIPRLEKQIQNNERTKEELSHSIRLSQERSHHALQNACAIKPVYPSRHSFFYREAKRTPKETYEEKIEEVLQGKLI